MAYRSATPPILRVGPPHGEGVHRKNRCGGDDVLLDSGPARGLLLVAEAAGGREPARAPGARWSSSIAGLRAPTPDGRWAQWPAVWVFPWRNRDTIAWKVAMAPSMLKPSVGRSGWSGGRWRWWCGALMHVPHPAQK
ncbi:MAG: hypothetical protein RMK65_01420 [Anaerolineae bacterium]|nr:hypothetical protein [Anaerolineae bacterium]